MNTIQEHIFEHAKSTSQRNLATADATDDRLPSEREDRTEGIIIMLIAGGKQVKSAQCGFRRSKEGDIFFEDWIASSDQIQLIPVQGGSLEAIA
jgi:hypothetical protein